MELLKRKILLEDSVDRNYYSPTYGTVTATSFYINVMLTQNIDDMGIFLDTEFEPNLGVNNLLDISLRLTGTVEEDYYDFGNSYITGRTESRNEDVRSYSASLPYQLNFDVNSETYVNYKNISVDGVDRVTATGNPFTYVFDAAENDLKIGTVLQSNGILMRDYTGITPTSVISYIGEGLNGTNSSLSALTKEEYLFGIISTPEIKSDVFIDRGLTTVFEKHLKLSEITNLGELTRYGNGYYNLFKI